MALCEKCTTKQGDNDYCPPHAKQLTLGFQEQR
jgi:hypothetical protein